MRAGDKQQRRKGKGEALERKIKTEVKEEGVGERGSVLLTWFTLCCWFYCLFVDLQMKRVYINTEHKYIHCCFYELIL